MTEDEFFSLKKGDAVVCNKSSYSSFSYNGVVSYTEGKVYVLREDPSEGSGGSVRTVADNHGRLTNGWSYKFFDPYNEKEYEDML
jgi:hypothetical protein